MFTMCVRSLQDMYPSCSSQAIHLVSQMLMFDPSKRITVEQALEHPYLASLHDSSDEPCASEPFVFEHDYEKLKEQQIRELVFQQALELHPEDPGKTQVSL